MNVITISKAAEIAQVSRQAIHNLKLAHESGKKSYSFFTHNPKTGKNGIDIHDKSWKEYLNRHGKREHRKTAKRPPAKKTKPSPAQGDDEKATFVKNVLDAVEVSVVEIFTADTKTVNKLKALIIKNYKRLSDG